MKRILTILLAAALILTLCACQVTSSSTSTTTITTSVTDADGNTTTNTITNEMGVSAGSDGVSTTFNTEKTTTTETPAPADSSSLVESLRAKFTVAATGTNDDGDEFYYLWREEGDDVYAALVIVGTNGDIYSREGWVRPDEDHVALFDEELDTFTPFYFEDGDDDDSFDMVFVQDGDVAHMVFADCEEVIADVVDVMDDIQG